MSHFDYFDGFHPDTASPPLTDDDPSLPSLTKSHSDNMTGYLVRCATNARYKLFRESSLRCLKANMPVVVMGKTIGPWAGDLSLLKDSISTAIRSIPWCTYRTNFPPILRTEFGRVTQSFTSDMGWGCTLRVGQMVLLYALSKHLQSPFDQNPFLFAAMVSENIDSACLSIHHIIAVGESRLNRRPGDWYAPSTIAHAVRYVIEDLTTFEGFKVSVAMDGGLFRDQMLADLTGLPAERFHCECDSMQQSGASCLACSGSAWHGSLLLFIPLMLGRKSIQSEYCEAVKFFLSQKNSIGIIGATGNSCVYIVGFQDDLGLYLDPHYVQESPRDEDQLMREIESFLCKSVGTLKLREMGASMTLAFWFQSQEELDGFLEDVRRNKERHRGVVFVRNSAPRSRDEEDLEDVIEFE